MFELGTASNGSPKSPISPVDSGIFCKNFCKESNNQTLPISKSKSKLSSYKGFTVGFYEVYDGEENVIGRGAYGVVLKGIDKLTRRKVAVKRLSGNIKIAELKILEELKSPWIVQFMGVYAKERFVYFVMELCDCDLAELLQNDNCLSADNVDTLTDNLARGYNVLYQMEIIHRDIKPQNILINFDKSRPSERRILVAKLTDFGISREVKKDSGVALSNLAGTLAYMAPEVGANIVDSNAYDAEVDMWSIGVLLFQSITGKEPFDEKAICKLFLYSCNRNFDGYKVPRLPDSTSPHYQVLIESLLTLDCTKRLQPLEFYNCVVKKCKLEQLRDGHWQTKQIGSNQHSLCNNLSVFVNSHKLLCTGAVTLFFLISLSKVALSAMHHR